MRSGDEWLVDAFVGTPGQRVSLILDSTSNVMLNAIHTFSSHLCNQKHALLAQGSDIINRIALVMLQYPEVYFPLM